MEERVARPLRRQVAWMLAAVALQAIQPTSAQPAGASQDVTDAQQQQIGNSTEPAVHYVRNCPKEFHTCPNCCDRDKDCNCDKKCQGFDGYECTMPHQDVQSICPEQYTICPNCCDLESDCKCNAECTMVDNSTAGLPCTLPHLAMEEVCPVGFSVCPKCCDRQTDCTCDDHCGMGPTGSSTDTFKCTVPHRKAATCPKGFHTCPSCCDRQDDCVCDSICGREKSGKPVMSSHEYKCTVARYAEEAHCPASFFICPHCCDRDYNCNCDNYCGEAPEGWGDATFNCAVPHRSEAFCPANYTMCADCCDSDSDCKCDVRCDKSDSKKGGSADFLCTMPHQFSDGRNQLTWAKIGLGVVAAVLTASCCWMLFKQITGPRSTPPPLLTETELHEDGETYPFGGNRGGQARQLTSSNQIAGSFGRF